MRHLQSVARPERRLDSSPVSLTMRPLFELPQLSFDLMAGRPRIVEHGGALLRAHQKAVYRYCGRSRWYPDFNVPNSSEYQVRSNLLAQPTLSAGEMCLLLTA
jgi:hypothetical protein